MTSLLACSDEGLNPQDFGKKITYYRRYALCAALGIAPDEDVDALGVEAPAKKPSKQKPKQKPKEAVSADDEWTSSIPDDILDKVKNSYLSMDKQHKDAGTWHKKVLKNFLKEQIGEGEAIIDAIKRLSREQLAELADVQNERLNLNKED